LFEARARAFARIINARARARVIMFSRRENAVRVINTHHARASHARREKLQVTREEKVSHLDQKRAERARVA
jgi:hypothetical protein